MPRSAKTAAALLVSLAAAACSSAPVSAPDAAPRTPLVRRAECSPQQALEIVREEAVARRLRILDMGPDSILLDLGTADARVSMPVSGLFGSSTETRTTEVRTTALYVARRARADGGADVAVLANPVYWHPQRAAWLPAPLAAPAGLELLATLPPTPEPAAVARTTR